MEKPAKQPRHDALIALGSNLPGRFSCPTDHLYAALGVMAGAGHLLAVSDVWQTTAWPDPQQPAFANAVCRWRPPAGWSPYEALQFLHATERRFGRMRAQINANRTLDLDLLAMGSCHLDDDRLTLPHPRMMGRAFVLFPLRDCAPQFIHPVTGQGVDDAIAALSPDDRAQARRWPGATHLHAAR